MKQHTVKYTSANCQISFIEIATEKMTHWSGNWNSKADMDAYYSDNQMHIVAKDDSLDINSDCLCCMCAKKSEYTEPSIYSITDQNSENWLHSYGVTPLQGSLVN